MLLACARLEPSPSLKVQHIKKARYENGMAHRCVQNLKWPFLHCSSAISMERWNSDRGRFWTKDSLFTRQAYYYVI